MVRTEAKPNTKARRSYKSSISRREIGGTNTPRLSSALTEPCDKAALGRDGTDVCLPTSSEQFGAFLTEDAKFWVNLVKSAGVKID